MRRGVCSILGAALGVVLLANVALATHNEPSSATTIKASLVTAYEACSNAACTGAGTPFTCCTGAGTGTCPSGATTTGANSVFSGMAACTPPARSDSVCGFGPLGVGSLSATFSAKSGDIAVVASASGLSAGCVGQTLMLYAALRATTDNCTAAAGCTVPDFPPTPFFANCVVGSTGKCTIKTTVNKAINAALCAAPGVPFACCTGAGTGTCVAITAGGHTGVEIQGCGLRRTTGPTPLPTRTFACGLLVP